MAQVLSAKSHRQVLSATILMGDDVVNPRGEDLGKIEELIIDLGKVAGSRMQSSPLAAFWGWETSFSRSRGNLHRRHS